MKLHLYILPARGDGDPEGALRAERSFSTVALQVTKIRGPQLYLTGAHYATWFGYIFDDEYLSTALKQALPTLLNHENKDFYVFFKRVMKENGEWDCSMCPRIFRSHVQLKKELLIPKVPGLKNEYILDGWVEQG